MSIRRRLEALEAEAERAIWASPQEELPIHLRIYCKATERHHARVEGRESAAFMQEEIAAMRESDLESVAGGGVAAELRYTPGWQFPEEQQILGKREEDARRRLEEAKNLPPERWHEVGGCDFDKAEEGE